jgi:transcriptional antiterminator RfaH
MQPWYVIHTKPRQEQIACTNLERQSYNVYFPRFKVIKRIQGQHQAVMEPLFPRYIFLQPSSISQSLAPVRSTTGVSTIVRFGLEPAEIHIELVQSIRNFEEQRNIAKDEDISPLQPGKYAQIVQGSLKGFEGLISRVSKQRVILLLQMLGQDTEVSFSQSQLLVVS